MIIFEWFIVLMWKHLNFQLFCFCYSVVNVGSAFTEAQPGSTLTALCFEIVNSLLRKIVEREFQILTLMNFNEPLEIKCNFQRPSSSDSPLKKWRRGGRGSKIWDDIVYGRPLTLLVTFVELSEKLKFSTFSQFLFTLTSLYKMYYVVHTSFI